MSANAPKRVEWSEDRGGEGYFLVTGQQSNDEWEFWERESWEVRWLPARSTPERVAKAKQLHSSRLSSLQMSFGLIRPWSSFDATALVKYANNRKVWLNMRDAFPHPYTETGASAFLRMVHAQNPTTFFAIATREEAIGGIGITLGLDVHRLTAELGYWLAEPYWGKGFMTEAVIEFTAFAFEHFKLVRIYAEPYANNPGSCRVIEKAGFTLEGRLRSSAIKDGRLLDQFLYAHTRPAAHLQCDH